MNKLTLISAFALAGFCSSAFPFSIELTPKTTLVIEQGDITEQRVDALVKPINQYLTEINSQSHAILAADGKKLHAACNTLLSFPAGQANIIPSFGLAKRGITHIIHAILPDSSIKQTKEIASSLYTSHHNALQVADATGTISTIAFSCVSFGGKSIAANSAIRAIKSYIENNKNTNLKTIYIITDCDDDTTLYTKTAQQLCADKVIKKNTKNITAKDVAVGTTAGAATATAGSAATAMLTPVIILTTVLLGIIVLCVLVDLLKKEKAQKEYSQTKVQKNEFPAYLYKIISLEQWQKSKNQEKVVDEKRIQFVAEQQLDAMTKNQKTPYVLLKVNTAEFLGKLKREDYYWLYDGSIPHSAIIESKIVTQ